MSSTVWETITEAASNRLERIRVPGGWLYRTMLYPPTIGPGPHAAVAMVFVPSPGKLRRDDPDDPGWPR